jgi:hypothetical protein
MGYISRSSAHSTRQTEPMLHPKCLVPPNRYLISFIFISSLFIGCRALTYEDPQPSEFSSTALRTKLESLLEESDQKSSQLTPLLNRLIPSWEESKSVLKASVSQRSEVADQYTAMRTSALRELPWALRAAREAGLTEIKIHRVGLHASSENAHGDVELLSSLKQHDGLYTVTLHRAHEDRGLRLSGWVYQHNYGWRCVLKLGEYLVTTPESASTRPKK